MTSTWTYGIPQTQPGDPVTAASINNPTSALAAQMDALTQLYDSITEDQRLVWRGVTTNATAGQIVYFDPTDLVAKPALAQYDTVIGEDGRIWPAENSVYCGVVTNVVGGVADIITTGIVTLEDPELTALFGSTTPDPATYYLSATTEGTVSQDPPDLAIHTVQYIGGKMVRVMPPAFDKLTHTHKEYTILDTDWLAVGTFDPTIVPAGAIFGVDLTTTNATDQKMSEVLLPIVGKGVFSWLAADTNYGDKGTRLAEADVIIDVNGIWWFQPLVPTADMLINATMAEVKGISVITTILNTTPDNLTITTNGSIVSIGVNEYTDVPDTTGGTVVKNIVGGQMFRGTVVENLSGGLGVSVGGTPSSPVISLAQYDDFRLSSTIQNLNNAITLSSGAIVRTQFPASRTSSAAYEFQIPHMEDDTLYEAVPFMYIYGVGTTITGHTLTVLTMAEPTGINPAAPAGYPTTMPDIIGDLGKVYAFESATAIDMTGLSGGLIFAEVGQGGPASDVDVLTTGILLRLK